MLPNAAPAPCERYPLRGIIVDYQGPTELFAEQNWASAQ